MEITLKDALNYIPMGEYVSIWFGERSNTLNGNAFILLNTLNENTLSKEVKSISSNEETILTITVRGE